MDDPVERRLLDTLASQPRDNHAREVYADWLEQHGYETQATFLRLDAVDDTPMEALAAAAKPLDPAWRAEVTRAKVARCVTFAFECTRRWADLERRDRATPNVRFCATCAKTVTLVATAGEANAMGREGHCIAVDPAVARGDLERAYDRGRQPEIPMMMGVVAPRPPPIDAPAPMGVPPATPPPKGKSVLGKIRDWFGK